HQYDNSLRPSAQSGQPAGEPMAPSARLRRLALGLAGTQLRWLLPLARSIRTLCRRALRDDQVRRRHAGLSLHFRGVAAPHPADSPHAARIRTLLAIAPVCAAASQTDIRYVLLHARQRIMELAIPRRRSAHAVAAADVGLPRIMRAETTRPSRRC